MKCPNCNKDMMDKSYEVKITFFTGDEPDYYPTEWIEKFHCKGCGITFNKGEWVIPKKYPLATNKQIKCAMFINKQLGTDFKPVLKTQTWRFIKENLSTAKEVYDNSFSQWCEENADWLPEYF